MKNYYEILEVDKNASDEIIKLAYKSLVKKYHPDLKDSTEKQIAEEKIKEINEAYDIISDPVKRSEYNQAFFDENISLEKYNNILNENAILKNELNKYKHFYNNYFSRPKNNYGRNNSEQKNNSYTNYEEPRYNSYSNNVEPKYENSSKNIFKNIFDNFSESFKNIFAILLAFLIIFIILKIPFFNEFAVELFGSGFPVLIIIILIFFYFFRNK